MNILDPKFRYVDSFSTDLRKTFARIRREQLGNTQVPARVPAGSDRNATSSDMTAKRVIN